MTKQKIGILGTGDVGKALGNGFVKLGYPVKMGSRDANNEKLKDWVQKAGPNASGGTFADVAKSSDVIVLATVWSGTENALKLAGPDNLAGKVVMDATNPLMMKPNALPELALGHTDSAGEQVQRWLPKARVVKVYNTVGNAHMVNPDFPGGPPDMFICGNDEAAKKTVTELCKGFGWPTIDLGGIEESRLLEPLALIWIHYAFRNRSFNHAFKLLKK